ncbi:hypothetical protein FSARC_9248 [Fusarium sarcochroum]|uniref:Uncharacterized protein n=1 Tax=Fusarium sarcochroum TaxID=1208366 RepID=A0A8H4X5H3_9HYPO|nr:hypothetical protein FSARC_9248 [Fusarium sarcochroum]
MSAKLFLGRDRPFRIYVPYHDDNSTLRPDEHESLPTTPRYVPDAGTNVAPTAQTQREDDITLQEPQSLHYVLGVGGRSASVALNSGNNHEGSNSKTIASRYAQSVHKFCLDVSINYIDKFRQDFMGRDPRAHDKALLCKIMGIFHKGPPTQSLRYNVGVVSDVFRVKGCVLEIFSPTAQEKTERDIRQLNERTEEVVSALNDTEHGRYISYHQLICTYKAGVVLCRMMDRGDMVRELKMFEKDWEDFKWFGDIGTGIDGRLAGPHRLQ